MLKRLWKEMEKEMELDNQIFVEAFAQFCNRHHLNVMKLTHIYQICYSLVDLVLISFC